MAITTAYELSAVTVGATELSIVSGTTTLQSITTPGVYQLVIDASVMAKGDEFRVKLYEKCKAAGTKRVFSVWSLQGVQSELFITPTFMLLNGWDMTITKLVGTDRAFDASIRKVA
ncbi:MAG: hypothetical protein IPN63_07985 [Gammaproteobacteria bacterium]|nr:hypothetical protein [Gammaproteobacteria bacterium]